jgi:hypothetical protein
MVVRWLVEGYEENTTLIKLEEWPLADRAGNPIAAKKNDKTKKEKAADA